MKLYITRHGETKRNKEQRVLGRTDDPLSEKGKAQAAELAEKMKDIEVDIIYTSPLSRAKDTAETVAKSKGMSVIVDDRLIETNFGDFEGKTAGELELDPRFAQWVAGKIPTPNGESNSDFVKRLCVGLQQIVLDMLENDIEHSAVIMHGGAIMMLLGACGVPQAKPVEWNADCGQGYSILVTPSLYHKTGVVEVVGII